MKSWVVGFSLLASVALVSSSFAASVTLDYVGHTPALSSSSLRVDFTGNTPTSGDATTVGAFKWTVNSQSGTTYTIGQTLYTFCIQASQSIQSGSTYTLGSLNGAPAGGSDEGAIDALAAAQIQGLVSKYWTALDFNNSVATNYAFNSVSYTDAEVAAAMQLAIWEIEYDGGSGGESYGSATNYFTAGTVRATATDSNGTDAITLAKGWLNSFVNDSNLTSIALLSDDTQYHYGKQDQLIGVPNPPTGTPPVVPLPAALPMGVSTLAGIGLVRKLRNRSRA